jgi:hypothetical protein
MIAIRVLLMVDDERMGTGGQQELLTSLVLPMKSAPLLEMVRLRALATPNENGKFTENEQSRQDGSNVEVFVRTTNGELAPKNGTSTAMARLRRQSASAAALVRQSRTLPNVPILVKCFFNKICFRISIKKL